MRISRARAPRWSGAPAFSRSLSAAISLKGPKEIASLVGGFSSSIILYSVDNDRPSSRTRQRTNQAASSLRGHTHHQTRTPNDGLANSPRPSMRHWLVNRTPFGQKLVSDAFKNGSRCSPAGQGTGAGGGREC